MKAFEHINFDLSLKGYSVEAHLKRCCVLYITDNANEEVKCHSSANVFIDNIKFTQLRSEIFQLPVLTRSEFLNFSKNSPLPLLWVKWKDIAKKVASNSGITKRTKKAMTCYFACLIFYFWLHQSDMIKYDSNDSFLAMYPQYASWEGDRVTLLKDSSNLMLCCFHFVKPLSNKSWILKYIIPCLTSEKVVRYNKSGGGTRLLSTGHNNNISALMYLYETEGNYPTSMLLKLQHDPKTMKGAVHREILGAVTRKRCHHMTTSVPSKIPHATGSNKAVCEQLTWTARQPESGEDIRGAYLTPLGDNDAEGYLLNVAATTPTDCQEKDVVIWDYERHGSIATDAHRYTTGPTMTSTQLFDSSQSSDATLLSLAYRTYFYPFEAPFVSHQLPEEANSESFGVQG